jgi:spore coat polysaccharide biosynthesis protein SpsF (cytidylyltransferase family)
MIDPDRVVILIQARTGSTRLPGKSLRLLHRQPLIAHVVRRAQATGFATWVATSLSDADTALARTARELGVPVYRGSEWDVLQRMAGAAAAARAGVVVRVTADCPLWPPDLALAMVESFMASDREGILTNDTTVSGWPDGLDVEVFTAATLQLAARKATDRSDREHVTPWMRRRGIHWVRGHDEDWRCPPVTCRLAHHALARPNLIAGMAAPARACTKLSIDTAEDWARVVAVLAHIPAGAYDWPSTRTALTRFHEEQS